MAESDSKRFSCRTVEGDGVRSAVPLDEPTAVILAQTFKALSDPTRVRMIAALAQGELCVHDLVHALDMTQSAVSHQLAKLRDMRLVRFTREGRHIYYTLDDDHIRDLFRLGLDHVRHA
ncbi:MAG: winged helix-turn-helix transcriptional regulator [Anaerolineae bacterium]|nr:winged helix-turn-helix transcriptional regulator [Anaerolineae bacterium]